MSTCHVERVCDHVLLLRVTEGEGEDGTYVFSCVAKVSGLRAEMKMGAGVFTGDHRRAIKKALLAEGIQHATWERWKPDRRYVVEADS